MEEYRSSPLPRNPQRLLLHTITGVSRDHLCVAKSIPPHPGCVCRPIVVNVSQKFSASSANQFCSASLDTPWVQCLKKGEAFDLLLLAVIAFINCRERYRPFISCIKVCVWRVQKFIVEVEAPVAPFTAAHHIEFYSLGFHLLAKSWILHLNIIKIKTSAQEFNLIQVQLKVSGCYSITFLNRTPICDWCVLRWRLKNKHHTDTYLEEIRLVFRLY